MTWGQVTIGGAVFRETEGVVVSNGVLRLRGQEATPPSLRAEVRTAHHNILGLRDREFVPVIFTDKTELSGFYRVAEVESNLVDIYNGRYITVGWSVGLERIGTGRDVEFESRLPFIKRSDALAGTQTASFWHAPAVGAVDYYTGSTVPSGAIERVSDGGSVPVFTGLPTGVPPRWTVDVADYMKGAARVELDDRLHLGTDTKPHAGWSIANGIVRLRRDPANLGGVLVESWGGTPGVWRSGRSFRFTVATGAALATEPTFTILRNLPEEVVVRLTYPLTPGRLTVDLALRRGSRFVTGVIKRHAAVELGIRPVTNESGATVQTGGLLYPEDAHGNRIALGTSRLQGSNTVGRLFISSGTQLDFFLGHEVGTPHQAGDAFADLLAQYLDTAGDRTRLIRR